MTDEEQPLFHPDVPQELQEELLRRMHLQKMNLDVERHDLVRFIDELDQDQSTQLRKILHFIVDNPHDRGLEFAAYLEGCVAMSLQHKFKICSSCGKNHDLELMNIPGPEDKPAEAKTEAVPEVEVDGQLDMFAETLEAYKADCEKFNVEPVLDEAGKPTGKVKCKGCGMEYVSLEDRAVKPVGECHGCQHKSAWG